MYYICIFSLRTVKEPQEGFINRRRDYQSIISPHYFQDSKKTFRSFRYKLKNIRILKLKNTNTSTF